MNGANRTAALRARHREELMAAAPQHVQRLSWDRATVEAHQRAGLRTLVRHAIDHSPYHARRLAAVDPARLELADLRRLPTMTKTDMMAHLDEVFTDRRLTPGGVEAHLAATGGEPDYLLDEYTVLASGGSSGERGVFVFDRPAFVDYALGLLRWRLAGGPPDPGPVAVVAAGSGIHATRALGAIFGGGAFHPVSIPVTLPLDEIVRTLNDLQPAAVQGYPSVLALLAEEQRRGGLHIAPRTVTGSSEQFPPETRAAVEAAFGVPVSDQFGSTEGVVGISAAAGQPIVLASDLAIVELVDGDDRPVPPGTPAARVLVTNLFNRAQPLIRYELTDHFVEVPGAPGHGHVRVTVEGRQDDVLRYADVAVHPLVLRSVLVSNPEIVEYQVRQTPSGADVAVISRSPIDERGLARELARALGGAGVSNPEVRVTTVPALDRNPLTGKAKRVVALPAPAFINR